MQEVLLKIVNLKKYFDVKNGMLHAVDDVNLSINRGETLGVVGESGCGKSTLGRTILRLTEPTAGQVLFEGKDIVKLGKGEMRDLRTQMQLIFQDPYASLNPRLSVAELISEPMIVTKCCKRDEIYGRVRKLMDTVGLAERLENAYPHELDGGRRQRIGIARALAVNPKFIVCDEPVSALDVSIQAQILNLLMDLQDELGLTYMFITHDLSVVKHISNNIAVMYLGQCVELANVRALFQNPIHPYTRALLDAIPIPVVNREKRNREIIHGEVTSPINPHPGCRFAARCKYATEECTRENIPLRDRGDGHMAACIKF
ncbi:ABC transporter ATP-binding protein [Anaerotruncus rubiinfantis]|uniref:ABC transporter ATP-binding protein n=1 Tax=Anaerotruncus rubiinfantis TaxID=1720200 RepID=UPI000832D1D2|nr:oligopeptide/dipeptide ABC transporter ATP-binding protein [Anaerotruncus rubiinfantis]